MREQDRFREATLSDYVAVLRRRKTVFIAFVVLVPLVALTASLVQTRVYSASAQVLLGGERLSDIVNGLPDSSLAINPDRVAQTQVDIARVEQVASRTLDATGAGNQSVADFLANSNVVAKSDADILVFTVEDTNRLRAVALANAYARQFTIYRAELDSIPIRGALRVIRSRIAGLEVEGNSQLLRSLRVKERQLETLASVQFSTARVLRTATSAGQVRPRTVLNVLIGLMVGVVLGTAAAFIRDATDTRVRSAKEVVDAIDMPVLALIPELPVSNGPANRLVMLHDPESREAEAFRMLRTKFDLANLPHGSTAIMFTSALENDGKSTVVANLAVALARGGRRVTLVDFDLRRPSLLQFFGLRSRKGLTTVALDAGAMEEALLPIHLDERSAPRPVAGSIGGRDSGGVRAVSLHRLEPVVDASTSPLDSLVDQHGELYLLPAGPLPANVGEFVENSAVRAIFAELRQRSDFVLVDAPPLSVSDAVALSSVVDAVVVVASVRVAERRALSDMTETLATLPATKLGVVVTDVTVEEHPYGGYGSYGGHTTSVDVGGSPALARTTRSASVGQVREDDVQSGRWQHKV